MLILHTLFAPTSNIRTYWLTVHGMQDIRLHIEALDLPRGYVVLVSSVAVSRIICAWFVSSLGHIFCLPHSVCSNLMTTAVGIVRKLTYTLTSKTQYIRVPCSAISDYTVCLCTLLETLLDCSTC